MKASVETTVEIKWVRILGSYLLCIVALQALVYGQFYSEESEAFYVDPRIGIYAIMDNILRINRYDSILFQWLTAVWLGIIGVLMVVGKPLIKVYVISELVLSLPNLVFFSLVLIANMRPAHGFSIRELYYPLIVMVMTTIMPFMIIYWRITKWQNRLCLQR